MNRDREEQVVVDRAPVAQRRELGGGIDTGDDGFRPELDAPRFEAGPNPRRCLLRDRDRHRHRRQHLDGGLVAHAPPDQLVVQHHRGFVGRGGALVERPQHADDRVAGIEGRHDVAHALRAGDRIELVAVLENTWGQLGRDVGAERDDQDVCVVRTGAGGDPLGRRIDRADSLVAELDRRLDDVAVVHVHGLGLLAPEHHIELRIPEHERFALVDESHLDRVRDLFREPRRQLQPAESRAEDQYPLHPSKLRHGPATIEAQVRSSSNMLIALPRRTL